MISNGNTFCRLQRQRYVERKQQYQSVKRQKTRANYILHYENARANSRGGKSVARGGRFVPASVSRSRSWRKELSKEEMEYLILYLLVTCLTFSGTSAAYPPSGASAATGVRYSMLFRLGRESRRQMTEMPNTVCHARPSTAAIPSSFKRRCPTEDMPTGFKSKGYRSFHERPYHVKSLIQIKPGICRPWFLIVSWMLYSK